MTTLVHADVFFFVTTIVVIIVGILAIIMGIIVIKILRNVRKLSEKAHLEGAFILENVSEASEKVARQGFGVRVIFRLFKSILSRYL